MARVYIFLAIAAVVFTVYTLVSAALTPAKAARTLPKHLWVPIILLLPVLGGVLWLIFGAPRAGTAAKAAAEPAASAAADFATARRHRETVSDAKISELEQRLRELDAEAAAAAAPPQTHAQNSPEQSELAKSEQRPDEQQPGSFPPEHRL